ncbi:unnamed protein product, partial [marine sediment metagenome]
IKCDDYALPSTAWQGEPGLEPDTTYYWKVRAVSSGTYSAWSAVGAFATETEVALEPLATPAPQAPPPSSPPTLSYLTTPDVILYVLGALLLTIVLLIITLLVVVIRLSRL